MSKLKPELVALIDYTWSKKIDTEYVWCFETNRFHEKLKPLSNEDIKRFTEGRWIKYND